MSKMCSYLWRNKTARFLIILAILGTGLFYLFVVFLNANTQKTNYLRMKPKPGYTKPVVSAECRKILADADLHPYGGKKRHVEFHEYGNFWAWDSAKTLMYKSSVMEHPQCFNILIQEMVVTKMRYILVIYDCENKSEVLVIRNYNK